MGKDNHAQGQHEQAESRDNGILHELIDQAFGHGRYDPPSDPASRDQFFAGTKNAENNPPKK